MTKGLRIWLGVCLAGFLIGVAMLFGTAANAAEGDKPSSDTSTSQTTTKEATGPTDWLAPGGIVTLSIGGVFMVVREVKSLREIDVNKYKNRAELAEANATTETSKLAAQIERLEKKLDDALQDVERKHDEWLDEVAHRRRLEILLAENGIAVPATSVTVTVDGPHQH